MNFFDKVYGLCKEIPEGKVSTYGSIADKLGSKAYRLVGQALRNNPDPINVPCYKIVRNNGEIGGYSGSDPKNIMRKIKMLESDGVIVENGKIDLKKYLFKFE
ncbi:MAG: cysteine methyltransferase [Nanoarchaeota archaeon]|nr:cysteine methyltransferase [Nanoarchaeota archaeon]|tara:strand:- start:754 stop:1062 length:309 start_codon:yes stop_codon:yes gene_type:complete